MPELPEVTALVEELDRRTRGSVLAAADLAAISVLKTFDPPLTACVGSTVGGVVRRGKFICWELAEAFLVVHLARAGWLKWLDTVPANPARPGRGPLMLRLVFANPDGEPLGRCDLTEAGTRKSGAVYVVRSLADVPGIARLGPDPLAPSFTDADLAAVLSAAGRSQLKGVLRDQRKLAGIGNAYSDEILHAARLSPFKPADSLDDAGVKALLEQIRGVLGQALDSARQAPITELKDDKRRNMRVHGRTGEACPVCGDLVREVAYADSSLQYCATCQTGGKPLADRRMSRLLK